MRIVTLESGARGVVRIGLDAGSFFLLRLVYLPEQWRDLGHFESLREGGGDLDGIPGLASAVQAAAAAYGAERMALTALARREHGKEELRKKLEKKGHDQAAVRDALDQLESEGLLSDERYADWFVRSRLRSHPLGERGLEALLRAKGLSKDEARKATAVGRDAILASLDRYARLLLPREEGRIAKKGLAGREASLALRTALWNRLRARGFSSPDIRSVLSRIAGSERNLDEPDEST